MYLYMKWLLNETPFIAISLTTMTETFFVMDILKMQLELFTNNCILFLHSILTFKEVCIPNPSSRSCAP